MVGSLTKLDDLPEENSLGGLELLVDAWCLVEVATKEAQRCVEWRSTSSL